MAINHGDTSFEGSALASGQVIAVRWNQQCSGPVFSSVEEDSVSIVDSAGQPGSDDINIERHPNTSLFSPTDVTSVYLYVYAYLSPSAEQRPYQLISPRSEAALTGVSRYILLVAILVCLV
eukprot:CAMPEP_0114629480 /NCGR_PEP_ID=MMETSP0168-20121206/13380_1 /TAXON_ID=95228 ORGANISM="Vannella sp., Strain DIVA3 517/6/12" /NCGR_SAMPLE_ID=MMETSP0168 /ASSEMBLY_ACC=CAM_ASM_000044 /LENGTH=120 /DNA_ID=CAMNT_0001840939 /DNA_START=262 /DNA_END=624 /DNA_ORIENTATION=+